MIKVKPEPELCVYRPGLHLLVVSSRVAGLLLLIAFAFGFAFHCCDSDDGDSKGEYPPLFVKQDLLLLWHRSGFLPSPSSLLRITSANPHNRLLYETGRSVVVLGSGGGGGPREGGVAVGG